MKGPSHVESASIESLASDLVASLRRLEELHAELADLIRRKSCALRGADLESMEQLAAEEQALVASAREQNDLRRSLTERIARRYGMNALKARRLTLTQVAELTPQPCREELRGVAQRLRGRLDDVRRANHTVGLLGEQLVRHLQCVWTAMTETADLGGCYRPADAGTKGARVPAPGNLLFEATA